MNSNSDFNLSSLYRAAKKGETDKVKSMLSNPNHSPDSVEGRTPLWIASYYGHSGIVEALLNFPGIDVNLPRDTGSTPLYIASDRGHEKVVELLLKFPGIDVNKPHRDNRSPLYVASDFGHEKIVCLLVKHHGIEVNKPMSTGRTPIWMAAYNGHAGVVEELLKHPSVDVNRANNEPDSSSPLGIAADRGHLKVVEALLKHPSVDVNKPRHDGCTPLYIASERGHDQIVELLLKHPRIDVNKSTPDSRSPLWVASGCGREKVVTQLLGCPGIEVNKPKNDGRSPLWMAAQMGHQKVVKLLLTKDELDVNKSWNGPSKTAPIQQAARCGRAAVVKLLLNDPRLNKNDLNWTPLHIGCATQDLNMCYEIITNESLPAVQSNGINHISNNPVVVVGGGGENHVDNPPELASPPSGLDSAMVQSPTPTTSGKLPNPYPINFEEFNEQDSCGFTPINYLCATDNEAIMQMLLLIPEINLLIPDIANRSPLWTASYEGRSQMVKWLLGCGKPIQTDLKAIQGSEKWCNKTAAEIAELRGYVEIAKLLKQYNTSKDKVRDAIRLELDIQGKTLRFKRLDQPEQTNDIFVIDNTSDHLRRSLALLLSISKDRLLLWKDAAASVELTDELISRANENTQFYIEITIPPVKKETPPLNFGEGLLTLDPAEKKWRVQVDFGKLSREQRGDLTEIAWTLPNVEGFFSGGKLVFGHIYSYDQAFDLYSKFLLIVDPK